MNITMSANGRAYLTDGLVILLGQTKSAQSAEKKAYLSTSRSDKQIELIEEASRTVPAHQDLDGDGELRTWEIPGELQPVYRDALLAYGTAVAKMRYDGESKYHVDMAGAKKRVVDTQQVLREIGDKRDILVEMEERERKREQKEQKEKADPSQLAIGDGVDGLGSPPPGAADVSPIRMTKTPARKAASKSPRPPNPRGRRFE